MHTHVMQIMHTHTSRCTHRTDAPDQKPGYYRAFGSASFLDDKQRVILPLGKDRFEIKAGPGSKVCEQVGKGGNEG